MKKREEKEAQIGEDVEEVVRQMQAEKKTIVNVGMIVKELKSRKGIDESRSKVSSILRKELGFSYRGTKKVPVQCNSARCLILRQQFALELLQLLQNKKRVINFDETWLNESSFIRKAWAPKNTSASMTLRTITPRLSLLGASDTAGNCWYALSHATTDSNVVMLFFRHLARQLDIESPGWQEDTVILLDNAPYHSSAETRAFFKKMQLPVMFTAPYSYSAAPIELLWSSLKLGELNPERLSTGKR